MLRDNPSRLEPSSSNRISFGLYAAVATAALIPRVLILFAYPQASGDSLVYLRVAENILANGCVSLSMPATAECVPDWGGNQLPGYPWFIAAVWFLFDESLAAVRLGQSLLFACAALYLVRAVIRFTNSWRIALVVGLIVSLSPVALPWARHIFTETLAIAATIWLFAEIIESLSERRLRMWQISVCLAAAAFVRIDMLSLSLPVVVAALAIHSPSEAFRRVFVVAILAALPLAGWSARSVSLGLGVLPPMVKIQSGSRVPDGYLEWGRTWSTNEYHLSVWAFPAFSRQYSRIRIPAFAFDSPAERIRVEGLLEQLNDFDRKEFPAEIDDVFWGIAKARIDAHPWRHYIWLPIKRSAQMWGNILTSGGFPTMVEMPEGIAEEDLRRSIEQGPIGVANLIFDYPLLAFYKAISGAHRLLLILTAGWLAVWLLRTRNNPASVIFWSALLFAVGRTFAFAITYNTSTRYIVEAAAAVELSVVLVLLLLFAQRRNESEGKNEK